VNGVTDVEVKFEERLAKVTFDDEMTNTRGPAGKSVGISHFEYN
jgi:hypothetical protein